MNITDVIKKDHIKAILKRKKNRIVINNDNNKDKDYKTYIILKKQLRRF